MQRTVLITGCSAGGLGEGLALAFFDAGLRVFATARDPSRMTRLQDRGIETFVLDVLSAESIAECVRQVSAAANNKLDILVNNAGGGYNMPVTDIDIDEAKKLFDLNVWSYIAVTQAFLPLLIQKTDEQKKGTMIINNTSVSSVELTPHNSVYHASKAAAAMFSDHMRLELAPFGVTVIDLKTGCVHSRFHANHQAGVASLPKTSLYLPIRKETESAMRNAFPHRMDVDVWAGRVVKDVLQRKPRAVVWHGVGAWRTWAAWTFFPTTWWDQWWRRAVGLDLLAARLKASKRV